MLCFDVPVLRKLAKGSKSCLPTFVWHYGQGDPAINIVSEPSHLRTVRSQHGGFVWYDLSACTYTTAPM